MPDFPVRVVSAQGQAAPAKVGFRTLTSGKPAVMHFYNGG